MNETVVTEDGIRLWAVREGDGNPVVFCHGGPGLWDMAGDMAEMLVDQATVIRWDQRGAGRSQVAGPYSIARSVADLDAIRRHFGLSQMALLGHSWGAQLALQYALDYPERVSKLVYVSGVGIDSGDTWRADYTRNMRTAIGDRLDRWEELKGRTRSEVEDREFCVLQWSADFADRSTAVELAEAMATPWFSVSYECNAAIGAENRRVWGTPELKARCATMEVPTLIVDGDMDIRPRWAVDSLEAALPHVTRVILKGAGHLPWCEDADGFRTAVSEFLSAGS